MKTVTFNEVSVQIFDGTLGVSLSGGADSAILAYILMSNTKQPIHFFTVASKEKQRRTVYHSANVIDKCIELTGKTNVYQHIKYVDRFDRDGFIIWMKSHLTSKLIDVMYSGTTAVPEESVLSTFNNKLADDIRTRRRFESKKPLFHFENTWYDPFKNLNKLQIKSLYDQLNVTDTLFPVSHSCESLTQTMEHCGDCWWCEERFWAFGKYR